MAVRSHTWREVFSAPKQAIAALTPALASRPQFLAYAVHDLAFLLPTLTHNLLALPLIAWTVRTADERQRAARYADQMIFEGFRP
jgi:glycerophosphoryl diester phosphodiesterase